MGTMGLQFGLEKKTTCFKRKFRWLFILPNISASGVNSLPPSKSARPSLTFKEFQVEHLNETLYYPQKPEWKPIQLVLFDLKMNQNPVFKWIQDVYDPTGQGTWNPVMANQFKQQASLQLLDGCGNIIEQWMFDNAYPQVVEFGDLDMSSSEYCTIDITLRYDRAYIVN